MSRSSTYNGGPSFSNGPKNGPPVTITGVQLGAAQDDRWGNGPSTVTA